jgi:hypothetical protein
VRTTYRAALDAKAKLEMTPSPGADVVIGDLRDTLGFRYRVSTAAVTQGGHGSYYRITNLIGRYEVCFIVDAGERYPTIGVQRGRCWSVRVGQLSSGLRIRTSGRDCEVQPHVPARWHRPARLRLVPGRRRRAGPSRTSPGYRRGGSRTCNCGVGDTGIEPVTSPV